MDAGSAVVTVIDGGAHQDVATGCADRFFFASFGMEDVGGRRRP